MRVCPDTSLPFFPLLPSTTGSSSVHRRFHVSLVPARRGRDLAMKIFPAEEPRSTLVNPPSPSRARKYRTEGIKRANVRNYGMRSFGWSNVIMGNRILRVGGTCATVLSDFVVRQPCSSNELYEDRRLLLSSRKVVPRRILFLERISREIVWLRLLDSGVCTHDFIILRSILD